MQIIIPTRNRIYEQITLQSLPPELRKRTTLVCPKREASELRRLYADVKIAWEPHPMKLPQKRAWIVQEWLKCGYNKIIMLDDDLTFSTRISAGDWHLRDIYGKELIPEFERLTDKLGPKFPHVGFGMRQGNNNLPAGWQEPGKMCFTLGYYLPIVAKCRWDLVVLRSDYAMTLQLLLKGHRNAVWQNTVADQRTDAPGGCSTYRTMEMSNAEAEKLAALFPEYVSVVERNYKGSEPRVEVICRWQKALRNGLSQK